MALYEGRLPRWRCPGFAPSRSMPASSRRRRRRRSSASESTALGSHPDETSQEGDRGTRPLGLRGRRRSVLRGSTRRVRRRRSAGPIYGLLIWLGFEAGIAPLLGLAAGKGTSPDRSGGAGGRPSALRIRSFRDPRRPRNRTAAALSPTTVSVAGALGRPESTIVHAGDFESAADLSGCSAYLKALAVFTGTSGRLDQDAQASGIDELQGASSTKIAPLFPACRIDRLLKAGRIGEVHLPPGSDEDLLGPVLDVDPRSPVSGSQACLSPADPPALPSPSWCRETTPRPDPTPSITTGNGRGELIRSGGG